MKQPSFLLILCLLMSCSQKEPVDLLITNANIYTVDKQQPKAGSMAIKDGKIVEVSTNGNLEGKYASTEVYDAQGATLVPGLIDAHCHFYGLGLTLQLADLVGTNSFAEVLERVTDFYKDKDVAVIRGRGWDQNDWPNIKFPTKDTLDLLFPDIPVVLERVDGHAYLVNQKALDLAGITSQTPEKGGAIIKENGEPTGVLVDNPMSMVDAVLPKASRSAQINALKTAEDVCFKYGLTTVSDAGLDQGVIELIDSLQQANVLNMKIYAMVSNGPQNLDHFLAKGIIKTPKLNVRSVKVYADGALGSRGAALKAPYSDKEGHFGAMVTPLKDMEALAHRLANSDYQMNTHAIGDSANAFVLRTYNKVLKGKNNHRWRIEHAQVVSEEDMAHFESGIIPSVQPTHATSDMYWAEDRLGQERIKGAYAYKTLLNRAGTLALGTDFPVEQVNPFLTFYAAVGRKDLKDYPEGGFRPEQALSSRPLKRDLCHCISMI